MFQPVIFRLGLRYISRRLLQSVLFILGVALGVAVVIAIDLANGSASRAFDLSTESITGRATHQITGGPAGLPTELYAEVRLGLELRDSAPVVSEFIRSLDTGNQPLRLLGVDPFAEPPFRSYLQTIELIGEDGDTGEALNNFIAEPYTALISQTLADRFGLQAGDEITLRPGTEPVTVRIVGTLIPDDRVSQQALDDLLLTDIATAQEIVGLAGRITRIDLILPDDYDLSQIESLLPPGVVLNDVQANAGALDQLTASFEINLQALSLLAVVVGIFLIYNTVTFSVVRRRAVLGVLRSLGMTKRQIFAFILGEAFILGLIGTILGMALGIILGRVMVGLVTRTISDLYFAVNVTAITVDPLILLKGAAIGLFTSIATALIPSYDATRTPPAGVLRRSQYEEQTRKLVPYITVAAVILCIIGYLLLQIPINNLLISFAALFAIIVGGAFFTPLMLILGLRIAAPITGGLFGVVGRMAPRAVVRSLSRTGVAVAALTIAISTIVGISIMIDSFRNTVSDWLDNTLGADIFISPPLLTANIATIDVDPDVRDLLWSVEGVERVSASRGVSVSAPDYPDLPAVNLVVVDFEISEGRRRFDWNIAPDGDFLTVLEAGGVIVSEPFAFRRGITPENNTIDLLTDSGVQTFTIYGVYYDYGTDQGTLLMNRSTYDQYWDDPFVSSFGVFVEPDVEISRVIDTLRTETLVGYDLQVQSNRDLKNGVFEIFDRTFTITIALRLLATVVAFIGILSALMSLQLENTREYGVMRANGMTGWQLWRFTLIQTGLMGTIAGVLAIPVGLALAVILVYVVNVRSFGWTMQLIISPQELITAFMVAIVAALLAGLYPAWRLTQLTPATALRSE